MQKLQLPISKTFSLPLSNDFRTLILNTPGNPADYSAY